MRAVRDKATSSEQSASVREMRCLKGLEESQIMVELWSGEQGSLEAGMLRDWRALTCLGSRGEVEMGVEGEGVLGVCAGVDVGDGEVEGEGAAGALVGEMAVVGGWTVTALAGAMAVVGWWTVAEKAVELRRRRRRKTRWLRIKIEEFGEKDAILIFLGRILLSGK